MASAAEQLAANLNFGAIAKAEEAQEAYLVHPRCADHLPLGTYIPLPGIDPEALRQSFEAASGGRVFWHVQQCSPAVPSSAWRSSRSTSCRISRPRFIMQLMTAVSPTLEALKKEGRTPAARSSTSIPAICAGALDSSSPRGIAVGLQSSAVS